MVGMATGGKYPKHSQRTTNKDTGNKWDGSTIKLTTSKQRDKLTGAGSGPPEKEENENGSPKR